MTSMTSMTTSHSEPILALPHDGAHWYTRDGLPAHTVKSADGKRDIAPDIRHARKFGLLPSVTNVLRVHAKEDLTKYKVLAGIMSALTLPRFEGESDQDFARRVTEDAVQEGKDAAEFGTRIHDAATTIHKTGVLACDDDLVPFLHTYAAWAKENIADVLKIEETVVNAEIGYAGRLDLLARLTDGGLALIDLKTQKRREGKRHDFYIDWGIQLAGYGACDGVADEGLRLISVIIPSREPGPCQVKEWDNRGDLWGGFLACMALWKLEKGYDPSKPASE